MHFREQLQEQISSLAARQKQDFTAEDRAVFEMFKSALNRGEIRAAEKTLGGDWQVNSWVKQGILLGFRMGSITDMSAGAGLRFFDKDTYPLRPMTVAENVRIVPGGSSIRDGAYIAPGVDV
jgi:2,3,4,5-tetrahydropyridine-2-carboxylate N-succinyltransferase